MPQTGAMTLVVAGEEVARGGRYSSKMPSRNRVQMLFVTLNKKKKLPRCHGASALFETEAFVWINSPAICRGVKQLGK